MSTFIQLHLLTSYPPANLNRDDLGRPKTAFMGGAPRLRISSQSLKRAWRTSDLFQEALSGHFGTRTKRLGGYVYAALLSGTSLGTLLKDPLPEMPEEKPRLKDYAWRMASVFVDKSGKEQEAEDDETGEADADAGKKEKKRAKKEKNNVDKETLKSEQLVFYSSAEIESLDRLIKEVRQTGKQPAEAALKGLVGAEMQDADIAMFGRMLAAAPKMNKEAAVQVAHAISVHRVTVEDDYFSAVDDLNFGEEDRGAGHIGETEFAAGLFYLYLCINCDLLKENLQGDEELSEKSLRALAEAVATVAPTGKQNSFASRAYASYILAEKGSRQPRSLSVAFLKPIAGTDMLTDAVKALKETRDGMDKVYGDLAESMTELNAKEGTGSLQALLDFVSGPCAKKT